MDKGQLNAKYEYVNGLTMPLERAQQDLKEEKEDENLSITILQANKKAYQT